VVTENRLLWWWYGAFVELDR